jgi:hypothetical protein
MSKANPPHRGKSKSPAPSSTAAPRAANLVAAPALPDRTIILFYSSDTAALTLDDFQAAAESHAAGRPLHIVQIDVDSSDARVAQLWDSPNTPEIVGVLNGEKTQGRGYSSDDIVNDVIDGLFR